MTPSTPAPGPTPRTTAQAANLKIILDRIDDNDFSGIDFIGSLQVLAEEVRRLSTPQGAGAVAWANEDGDICTATYKAGTWPGNEQYTIPLYTHPSPSSPNVGGLTEDDAQALVAATYNCIPPSEMTEYEAAAHKLGPLLSKKYVEVFADIPGQILFPREDGFCDRVWTGLGYGNQHAWADWSTSKHLPKFHVKIVRNRAGDYVGLRRVVNGGEG